MIYYPALILYLPFAIWALFGNREDGIWGDKWWNPNNSRNISYAIGWWVRNPFHNLTWHVIGFVGWPFKRYGKYPSDNYSPVGGWNYTVLLLLGFIPLPYISFSSTSLGRIYIGWRENGAFGFTFTKWFLIIPALLVFPNLRSFLLSAAMWSV